MSNLQSTLNGSPKASEPLQQLQSQLLALGREKKRREENLIWIYFPDKGPLRRELYPKHMEFFREGKNHRERLFLKGNQIGGTLAAGMETTFHLTGQYPPWWEGKRFARPIHATVSGQTAKTTRDIIQETLFGPPDKCGTGIIPKAAILRATPKHGLADAYDTAYIAHITGGASLLKLKSYDQGKKAYYGTKEEVEWLDEEGPVESTDGSFMDIYLQCLMRTIATDGIVIITMTPLQGRTPFIDEFLRGASNREELEYK